MGWPVAHSRSPILHNYWLRKHQIDGAYVPLAVDPQRLETALRGLSALGFSGCNITVPHKENALKLVDEVDDLARKVGAINTVIVTADGKLKGTNTDVFGFSENLNRAETIWNKRRPALVVGSGGAARAIIVALAENGCSDIRIVNRTHERATELANELRANLTPPQKTGLLSSLLPKAQPPKITVLGWPDRAEAMQDIGLLVNTTTQGMEGQPPLDLDLRALNQDALVTDLVYTPLITPLLAEARRRNHGIVDGLGMLLYQAVPGFAAWFGQTPVVDDETRTVVMQSLQEAS